MQKNTWHFQAKKKVSCLTIGIAYIMLSLAMKMAAPSIQCAYQVKAADIEIMTLKYVICW